MYLGKRESGKRKIPRENGNLVSERLGTGGKSGKRKVGNKEPRRRDLGKTGAW